MTAYADGRRVEYAVIDDLTERGFRCTRAASSKGVSDVTAFGRGVVLIVSVKRSKPLLPPAERVALVETAELVPGVVLPLVAYSPPRKGLRYRQLTGTGPKDWVEWPDVADRVAAR